MGNKSSKGNSKADLSQGFHCFYIKGKNEVRCFLIIQEDFLILMQSDKKNALMSISLDQSFKVTSEVQEKLSLVISYSSIKGLSTCILKTETALYGMIQLLYSAKSVQGSSTYSADSITVETAA